MVQKQNQEIAEDSIQSSKFQDLHDSIIEVVEYEGDDDYDYTQFEQQKFDFQQNGCKQRVFLIHSTVKAVGQFRPSFVFDGDVVEFQQQFVMARNPQNQVQANMLTQAILPDSENQDAHVIQQGLRLSLRYEPPSPKFRREYPGCSSYRLKVFKGAEFLYSMRGLREEMVVDKRAMFADWGQVSLAFVNHADLQQFLNTLKHVIVVDGQLAIQPKLDKEREQNWVWRNLRFGGKSNELLYLSIVGVVVAGLASSYLLYMRIRQ